VAFIIQWRSNTRYRDLWRTRYAFSRLEYWGIVNGHWLVWVDSAHKKDAFRYATLAEAQAAATEELGAHYASQEEIDRHVSILEVRDGK